MRSVTTSWISCTAVAVFMSMRLEQIHEKDFLRSATPEFSLQFISWEDNVYTWRKQNEKHKNRHWPDFMIRKEMCLTLLHSCSCKLTFIFECFCFGYMSGMHNSDLTLRSISLKESHSDERRKWITSDLAFALQLFKSYPICYA